MSWIFHFVSKSVYPVKQPGTNGVINRQIITRVQCELIFESSAISGAVSRSGEILDDVLCVENNNRFENFSITIGPGIDWLTSWQRVLT